MHLERNSRVRWDAKHMPARSFRRHFDKGGAMLSCYHVWVCRTRAWQEVPASAQLPNTGAKRCPSIAGARSYGNALTGLLGPSC